MSKNISGGPSPPDPFQDTENNDYSLLQINH